MEENILAVRLSELLEKRNLSQKDLADKTGLTEPTISRYIKGKRLPRWNDVVRFADVLGVTVDYFTKEPSVKETEETTCEMGGINNQSNKHKYQEEEIMQMHHETPGIFVDRLLESLRNLEKNRIEVQTAALQPEDFRKYIGLVYFNNSESLEEIVNAITTQFYERRKLGVKPKQINGPRAGVFIILYEDI